MWGDDIMGDTEHKFGFNFGGFITFRLNEQFLFCPEIYYSSKGYKLKDEFSESDEDIKYEVTTKGDLSFNYLTIPVLAVFEAAENFNLFASPYLDIFLSGEAKAKYEETTTIYNSNGDVFLIEEQKGSFSDDIKDSEVSNFGYGLVLGTEYIINNFSFGARYLLG